MAHRMNDDILKVILATLQRLETRFNDQDERLSTIEFSMLSEASGSSSGKARLSRSHSNCCSCAMSPAALFQGFQRESKMSDLPMATAYMASMDKLRSRFDFDEQSEMRSDYNCETHSKMDVLRSQDLAEILDAYSVSVYPSRPLSRLDMGSGDDVPEVPEIPAFRYDEATSPTDSASSHDSTSSGTNRTSLSESQRSASTAPTSITQPEVSPPSMPTKKASAVFSKVRASLRRRVSFHSASTGSVVSEGEPVVPEPPKMDRISEIAPNKSVISREEKESPVFIQATRKGVKACVGLIPRMVSGAARIMVNQQMKMLDIAV